MVAWSRLEDAGFLTANEKRVAAGYGPVEGGDELKRAGIDGVKGKFNPHHDALGRFTTADGAGGGARTPTPRMGHDDARITPAGRGPAARPPSRQRPGIGHNRPPADTPRGGTSTPPSPPMEPRQSTELYRSIHGMPPAGCEFDTHTVAHGTLDGKSFIGVNSTAPGYTDADREVANELREKLIEKYFERMKTENIGQRPNNYSITLR